jgi:hypothetical protein
MHAPPIGTRTEPPVRAQDEPWIREATRVSRRYQLEIVEGCGLCPWAERARLEGRVAERVLLQTDGSLDASVRAITELAANPRAMVGFLIYPRLPMARSAFEAFTGRIRVADAARHALGEIPFVMAAFHPEAEPDLAGAERLIPFLRRTPDPTLQLLRTAEVERVRSGSPQGTQFFDASLLESSFAESPPPLRERIARANLATAQRMGIVELTRRLDDIRRDRDETYRTLSQPAV